MKKVTLEKVRKCLRDGTNEVTVPEEIRQQSLHSLNQMLALA